MDDVVDALTGLFPQQGRPVRVLNVATEDYLTVREIADLVAERLGIEGVEYRLGDGARGWKGDVPVVRFDSSRARAVGWSNARTSREAMAASIDAMVAQLEAEEAARG